MISRCSWTLSSGIWYLIRFLTLKGGGYREKDRRNVDEDVRYVVRGYVNRLKKIL